MTIYELCHKAYSAAKAKGFHDAPLQPLESYMLICSEIAEAAESLRVNEPTYWYKETLMPSSQEPFEIRKGPKKPEGQIAELADAVIRICDMCGANGWDLEKAICEKLVYNETRPYKHGKIK